MSTEFSRAGVMVDYSLLALLLALTLGECVRTPYRQTPERPDLRLHQSQVTIPLVQARDVRKRQAFLSTSCNQFAHFPGAITIGGDILQKIGDGYSADHCKLACNDITEFVCVGALMQLPDTCFVTGYDLQDNYFSVHYGRMCAKGPRCYNSRPYTSAGFTQVKEIPWYFTLSNGLAHSFCMVQCEKNDECVGFDLITLKNNKFQCRFQDPEKINDSSFDLYIRRC